MKVKIGIIGGSGVYNLDGLENPNWIKVYLAHDGFVNNDINMGFQSAGFKTK